MDILNLLYQENDKRFRSERLDKIYVSHRNIFKMMTFPGIPEVGPQLFPYFKGIDPIFNLSMDSSENLKVPLLKLILSEIQFYYEKFDRKFTYMYVCVKGYTPPDFPPNLLRAIYNQRRQ